MQSSQKVIPNLGRSNALNISSAETILSHWERPGFALLENPRFIKFEETLKTHESNKIVENQLKFKN